MDKRQLIYDLRFGFKDMSDLSNDEVMDLIEYNLPHDVMDMCFTEIRDRRQKNLAKRVQENEQ